MDTPHYQPHHAVIQAQAEGEAIPSRATPKGNGYVPLAETLAARGNRYGTFSHNARVAQELKVIVRRAVGWASMDDDQKEAVDMILSKISRLTTGDPGYTDNWHDIAGYAKLIEDRLQGKSL